MTTMTVSALGHCLPASRIVHPSLGCMSWTWVPQAWTGLHSYHPLGQCGLASLAFILNIGRVMCPSFSISHASPCRCHSPTHSDLEVGADHFDPSHSVES